MKLDKLIDAPVSRQCGLGIRPEFFDQTLSELPTLGFLEAHSENYFGESLNKSKLLELGQHYPISLHGVGLSLGRADDLDIKHLQQLKHLVDEVKPIIVSEHLAWSAYSHRHIPDLLPLPLTRQSLDVMCQHIDQMQQYLGRQVLVENPSNYLLFDQLQMPEPEFLNLLAEKTGCGLLIDVNNIYVSAMNVGRDPEHYLQCLNSPAIGQYHLAGFTEVQRDYAGKSETLLIDTHDHPVYDAVWGLFEQAIAQHGARPTIFEWDADFPEFNVLLAECGKATARLDSLEPKLESEPDSERVSTPEKLDAADNSSSVLGDIHTLNTNGGDANTDQLSQIQTNFLNELLELQESASNVTAAHEQRLSVYQNNFYGAMQNYLAEVYPATRGVVGEDFFRQMVRMLLMDAAPSEGNIHQFGHQLNQVLGKFEGLDALPYLADLLQYEWAMHCAYYADTHNSLDPTAIPQAELLSLEVVFNNSVQIISSKYPLYEIYRQSLPGYEAEVSISLEQSQDRVLVYKCDEIVHSLVLTDPLHTMLEKLTHSENLLQAIEDLSGSIDSNDLSASLGFIFENRLLRPVVRLN